MEWTLELIKIRQVGVLHVANEGFSTPYQMYELLKKYILPGWNAEKITKKELNELTPNRRVDTVLDVSKLKSLGLKVIPLDKRVEDVIKGFAENIKKTDKKFLKQEFDKTMAQSKQRTVTNNIWISLL